MYVKITANDQVLDQFCYLPLVSGRIYQAKNSVLENLSNPIGLTRTARIMGTFFDVIVDEETIVKGVHESRLKVLTQDEIREFKINQIIK